MTRPCDTHDYQALARRRVPRMFFDYVDSGSWTESTYRANQRDFQDILLRQRVAVDMTERSLRSRMMGQEVAMPVALAPAGLTGMLYPDGEILAARAAQAAGVPFTLSTMSVCSIEDVARNTDQPFWFQLYMMKDRDFAGRLIDRARDAGCSALMLTLDLQILGQRHKDIRNGLSVPPKTSLNSALQVLARPGWIGRMLTTRRRTFGNIVGHARGVTDMSSLSSWTAEQFDPKLSWHDIEWIRQRWGGKLILKGVLDPADARLALDTGADALIVSNHGGRQLDGAPSCIQVLPEILEAVDGRMEVHMDGGIRSGQDVLKALCLGASGVHLGRVFLYGLAAAGQAGVTDVLDIIRRELDTTMALCGERKVSDLGLHNLYRPGAAGD